MTSLVRDPYKLHVVYNFEFPNGEHKSFEVDADLTSNEVKHYSPNTYTWAELEFNKCANCPLGKQHKYCPAALSLVDIIEYFSTHQSYATSLCRVEFPEKTVTAQKSLQETLYPLMGLRMATSQCPVLRKFKAMARFHEPFSSPYYTVYRALSQYLLGRYFANQKTENPDWTLDGLRRFYVDVKAVNEKLAERLVAAKVMDATPNSIVILSMFSMSMTSLFDAYLGIVEKLFDQ